jgi:hypothetical protein
MRLAAHKLPVKTKFLVKGGGIIYENCRNPQTVTPRAHHRDTKLREEIAELKRRITWAKSRTCACPQQAQRSGPHADRLGEQLVKEAK